MASPKLLRYAERAGLRLVRTTRDIALEKAAREFVNDYPVMAAYLARNELMFFAYFAVGYVGARFRHHMKGAVA